MLGLCVILILLGIIIYIFTQSSFKQDGRSIPVKAENKQQEYPIGARKLDQPILGAAPKNNNTASDIPHGEEFDFSPIENAPLIERIPVLPKKYIKETETNEFQQLWNDSNNDNQADHLNISKAQYDIMTMTDLKKISHEYLPHWKANAATAMPIKTSSIYALVVNYDPQTMPIDMLPKGFPLTIAIDGYAPQAQQTVNYLKNAGFEVILNLPVEVDKSLGIKSGAKPITSNISYETIATRVQWHVGNVTGHIGFKNKYSSPVLSEFEKMNFMMHELKKLGYSFLEVNNQQTDYRSVAYATAETAGLPTYKTSSKLNEIDGDFQKFLRNVSKAGSGVAIVDANEKNMMLMRHILDQLKNQKEVGLVYLSSIYSFNEMKETKLAHE